MTRPPGGRMSWSEVYPWSPPPADGPVGRHVYGQVRDAIFSSALGAGARLPSSRDLAARLGVARATVVGAYDQLVAEGYVESRRGAGAFVAADLSGVLDAAPAETPAVAPPPSLPERAAEIVSGPTPPPTPGEAPFNTGRTRLDVRALGAWRRSARRVLRSL